MGWSDNVYASNQNFGEADSWGGPMDGIDVIEHVGSSLAPSKTSRVSEDTYMFFIIVGALACLWLLGGVFRSARLG